MPLGSVEEWRSRIGSSWCALGRPVKSVVGGGVTRTLSGDVMLEVLSVLMMLTQLSVMQRVRGVNVCVSEYHRQLKSNFHPKTVAKQCLFVMILLLQAQSFLNNSLLLRCGDIESNPGPGLYPDLDYDNIDSRTILVEDDFRDVMREVVNIQTNYYQFGAELGLPPRELDAIRKQFMGDVAQCFTEVLLVWLRHRYYIDKYGPPTWRRLVEAVDHPSGGNNHALAKAIASKHPSVNQSQPTQSPESTSSTVDAGGFEKDCHSLTKVVSHSSNKDSSRSLFQRCRDTLVAYYLRLVEEHVWPPIKVTSFINLAIIKEQTSWRRTVQKSVDEVVGDKESTSYYDMLNDIDKYPFILLEGRPGCGKTTLMNKISRDWSNGEVLKSKLVIFIPLRRLNDEPDRSMSTLIRVACPALSTNDISLLSSSILESNGENVVFAFDGLDEYRPLYTPGIPHKREGVLDILRGRTLPKSLIILTSRPVASMDFRMCAKKWLEVLGFLKEQVFGYIRHYFVRDETKAQHLISHLEHRPNIMNMAYLPLHCAMLVFLYEEDAVLPETETEFYKHFTLSTLIRSLRKRKIVEDNFSLSSFTDLPRNDKRQFDVVCQLAFDATAASKQVFKYSELKHKLFGGSGTVSDESGLGLVVIDRYFMKCGLDETYTFLHLTFQEYLAALHIAGLSEHDQRKAISDFGNKKNFTVVWRFFCGIIDYSNPKTINVFKRLMDEIYVGQDSHGFYKDSDEHQDQFVKVQCCYESRNSLACTHVIQCYGHELTLSYTSLTPSECAAIGYTINNNPDHVFLSIKDRGAVSFDGALSLFHHIGQHPFSLTLKRSRSAEACMKAFKRSPLPGLLHLSITETKLTDEDSQNLGEGLKHCSALDELYFAHASIGPIGARAIGEGLKHCIHLKSINLSDNNIGEDGICAVGESLEYCVNLQHLNLSNNSCVGGFVGVALGRGLMHCTNLTELDLGRLGIGDAGAQALGEAFKNCTKLTSINISSSKIRAEGACAIGEGLKYCVELKTVHLGYNRSIGATGAQALAEAFEHCTKLTHIQLGECGVGNAGAIAMGRALKKCVHVRLLDLCSNDIGSAGLQALAEGLKCCKNICEVDLWGNMVSDDGVPHIIQIMTIDSLQRLKISVDNLKKEDIDRLKESVKRVQGRNKTFDLQFY